MTHNLLPPFMLREAGIQINEVPKIHVTSPTEEHHAIIFKEENFRIPLTLHGTFSYFPTSKPTTQELEEPEDVYVLTPTTWNPHSDALTEFRQPLQVQIHLEMPRILVQLGHTQRT